MSAEEIPLNSQLVFQDDSLRFNCGPPQRRVGGDPGPKTTTRELTGFIDDKLFSTSSNSAANASDRYFSHQGGPEFPRNIYRENRNWNGNGSSGDESDGEDDDEDDDVDDDDVDGADGDHDNEVRPLVAVDNTPSTNNNSGNNGKNSNTATANNNNGGNIEKIGNGKLKHQSFGSIEEVMEVKDGGGSSIDQTGNNAVNIAEPDGEMYYSQYLQATEGSGSGGKDMVGENGCGFSGRKEGSSFSSESGESLRAILSDPVTGALMDDAMILPCGHSFGAGGLQHIIRMKACYTCSQLVSEDSISPNLSLRAAVQAFCREDELQFYRSSKRRREKFEDKGGFGDSIVMDTPRGRGVQFPFAVTDRVIIKGNKRTPQRFVGRQAVVTTQCLNGWYVVKTLDNAESVKLQYRSLAKVSDEPSSKVMSNKMATNWL